MKIDIGFEGFFVHLVDGASHVVGRSVGGKALQQFQTAGFVEFIHFFNPGLEEDPVRIADPEVLVKLVFDQGIIVFLEGVLNQSIFMM